MWACQMETPGGCLREHNRVLRGIIARVGNMMLRIWAYRMLVSTDLAHGKDLTHAAPRYATRVRHSITAHWDAMQAAS